MNQASEGRIRPPGPDPKASPLHWLQFIALKILMLKAALTPLPLALLLGRIIGKIAYWLDRPHRRIALLNLDQVFGSQHSEREKRALVKACYRHFGRALIEILRLERLSAKNYLQTVTWEGVEGLEDALKLGQGAILCTAHYGNWEIMNTALGFRGLPMSVMARPMDNPLVHDFLEKLRTRTGNKVIYKHKSVRKLLSNLKDNRVIGIVNDQNVHDRNKLMVPFFGRHAATTPVPAALAYKTGAPIVTGYAQPLPKGRYLLRYDPPIFADQNADKQSEIDRITLLLNQRLEAQIRRSPASWFWVHKRFKSGLEGESDFYRTPRNI